jgi:hypothetical protein
LDGSEEPPSNRSRQRLCGWLGEKKGWRRGGGQGSALDRGSCGAEAGPAAPGRSVETQRRPNSVVEAAAADGWWRLRGVVVLGARRPSVRESEGKPSRMQQQSIDRLRPCLALTMASDPVPATTSHVHSTGCANPLPVRRRGPWVRDGLVWLMGEGGGGWGGGMTLRPVTKDSIGWSIDRSDELGSASSFTNTTHSCRYLPRLPPQAPPHGWQARGLPQEAEVRARCVDGMGC